jgi:hypothetical protein
VEKGFWNDQRAGKEGHVVHPFLFQGREGLGKKMGNSGQFFKPFNYNEDAGTNIKYLRS